MRKYRTNNRDVCIGWGHRAKLIFSDVSQYTDSRGREEWIKKKAKPEEKIAEGKENIRKCEKETTNIRASDRWIEFKLREDRDETVRKLFDSVIRI